MVKIIHPSDAKDLDLPGRKSLGVSVDALHSAGYRVVPWTVNDRETMRTLLVLGVDGIISDYPDVLIEEVQLAGGRVSPGGRVPAPAR